MIDAVIVVGCLAVGFVSGWILRRVAAQRYIRRLHDLFAAAERERASRSIKVKISKDGDQFYVHNHATGEFLTQGSSYADVIDRLDQHFPGNAFVADRENLRDVGFDATVRQTSSPQSTAGGE